MVEISVSLDPGLFSERDLSTAASAKSPPFYPPPRIERKFEKDFLPDLI